MTISKIKYCLFYLLVIFIPANGLVLPLGRNWTILQITTILLAGVYALESILLRKSLKLNRIFFFSYIGFLAVAGLSIVFMPKRPLFQHEIGSELVGYGIVSYMQFIWLLMNLLMVLFIYNGIGNRNELYKVFRVVLYASCFYASYAFYQFFIVTLLGSKAWLFVYIFKPEYLWGPEAIRVASLAREPLYYSFYLTFIILLSFYLFRNKRILKKIRISHQMMKLIFILNFLAFFLGKPTAGFLAIIFCFGCIYLKSIKLSRYLNLNKLLTLIFSFLVGISLLFLFYVTNENRIIGRLTRVSDVNSGYSRIVAYAESIDIIKEYYKLGVGLGNSGFFISVGVLGNAFLVVLVELGITGFIIYLFIWLHFWKAAKKLRYGEKEEMTILGHIFTFYLIASAIQFNSFHGYNLPSFWFFTSLLLVSKRLFLISNEENRLA